MWRTPNVAVVLSCVAGSAITQAATADGDVRFFDSTNFADKPGGEGSTLRGYEPIFEIKDGRAPDSHPFAYDTERRVGLWTEKDQVAQTLDVTRVQTLAEKAAALDAPVMLNLELDVGTGKAFNAYTSPTAEGAANYEQVVSTLRDEGFGDLALSNWGTWVQTATDEMLAAQDWVCIPAYHFPETEKLTTFFRRIDEAVALADDRVPGKPLGICLSPRDNKNDAWLSMETWQAIVEHVLTYQNPDRPLWVIVWGGPLLTYDEGEPYTQELLAIARSHDLLPEPGTVALLCAAGAALASRRSRAGRLG